MDAAQEAAVVERLGGGVQMRQAYGMTELSPIALVSGEHDHRPGTSGRLPPNTACKIVDPETGAALPNPGQVFQKIRQGLTSHATSTLNQNSVALPRLSFDVDV